MDPQSVQITHSFNLGQPFPTWAIRPGDGAIYIFHGVGKGLRDAGYRSGITRLDLAAGTQSFVPTPNFPLARGFGVYRDRPCLAYSRQEASGLRCLNDDGDLELKIPQKYAVGVQFGPSKP